MTNLTPEEIDLIKNAIVYEVQDLYATANKTKVSAIKDATLKKIHKLNALHNKLSES